MKSIFILNHWNKSEDLDSLKLIDVYSSYEEAKLAIKRLINKNGFKSNPAGFHIEEYEINKDPWTKGFASMTSIQVKLQNGDWETVSAECLPNDTDLIIEEYKDESKREFRNGDIVKCRLDSGELYAIEKIN